MSDISGGNEKINTVVSAETEGVEEAVSELQKLINIVKELKQTLNSFSNNLPQKLKTDEITTASKSFRQLEREITKVNGALGRTNGAARAGVAGMTAATRATKSGEKAFKEWSAANEKMGLPIVGRPETLGHIKNNLNSLKKSLGDSSKASMVTMNTFRSLEDGIERVGGRGLNSFERLRVKMFAVNRGIDSLAYNMQDAAKKMQWTGRTMFTNITLPVVGAMAVVSNEFIRFEKQFFQLRRVLEFDPGVGNTWESMREDIQGLAIDMGMSQNATAQLYTDIAALGVAASSVSGWAQSISQVAAIGDVDLSVATEFFRTANALFTEGSSAERLKDTTEIMAKMSAIADETSLQLKDLSDAFPEVAPIMAQMNLEAEEVAASLAGMYKRGIPASEAAHALKFSIQRLLGPTAETERALTSMGFAAQDFADLSGAAFGENALERLAVRLMALPIEDKQRVMGELFGKRQAARMTSWAEDVTLGLREVERAMSDGVIKAEEMKDITSDYARSMIASDSGEITSRLTQAGIVLEGFDAPMQRFENNVKMFKESPALQWESLKTQFRVLMADVGAIITPTLLEWGQKFSDFLNKLMEAPPQILKMVSAMGALAAIFGPVVIALSSFKSVFAGVLKITSKLSTRGALRDLMPGDALRMLEENPYRQDIVRVGNKYLRKTGRATDKIKIPAGATDVTSPSDITGSKSVAKLNAQQEITKKTVKAVKREAKEAAAAIDAMGVSGVKSAAAATAANERLQASYQNLDNKLFAASMKGNQAAKAEAAVAAWRQFYDVVDEENKKLSKANIQDLNRKSDASRLFGSAGDAKRSGQIQGMTWGRWFGKNADESLKGWKAKTGRVMSTFLTPRGMGRAIGGAKNDVVASVRGGINIAKDNVAALGPQAGILQKIKAILPGLKTGFVGLGIVSFKVLAVIGLIVAVIGTIAAVGYAMFRSLADNWDKAKERIQPAIDAVKAAFDRIKEAIGNIVNALKGGILGTLFEDSQSGTENMGLNWETAANIIKTAIDAIASAMEVIADIINFVAPVFSWIGKIIGSTIGFIISLFRGDWKNAFWYFVNVVFQVLKPIVWILDVLSDAFVRAIQYILGIIRQGVSLMIAAFTALPNGIAQVVKSIVGIFGIEWDFDITQSLQEMTGSVFDWADNALTGIRDLDWAAGIEEAINGQLNKFSSDNLAPVEVNTEVKPEDDSLDDLREATEQAAEEGASDGASKGASDGLKNAADEILKNFLSILKPRVRKQMDAIRQELSGQFEKAAEAKIKSYDDQIAAIDAAAKAEEDLLKTEEYNQKRRELLAKRFIDIQNYQRNRALAIYEGRISDVRQIDIEYMLGSKDSSKSLSDLDKGRQRDLARNESDERKKRINDSKDFEQERLEISRSAFEKQLDLILEYEPRTVEEFNNMLERLKSLATDFSLEWPNSIKTGGEYYMIALQEANSQIISEFGWAGEQMGGAAIMGWVNGFINSEAWAILMNGIRANMGAAGGAMDPSGGGLGGGGGGLPPLAPGSATPASPSVPPLQMPDATAALEDAGSSMKDTMLKIAGWIMSPFVMAIITFGPMLLEALGAVFAPVRDFLYNIFVAPIINIFNTVSNIISTILTPVIKFLQPIFSSIGNAISAVADVVGGAFSSAFTEAKKTVETIAKAIMTVAGPAFGFIGATAKLAWTVISVAIQSAWIIIKPIFDLISSVISTVVGASFDMLKNIVQTVWSAISEAVSQSWGILSKIFNKIADILNVTVIPVFDFVREKVKISFEFIRDKIGEVAMWIGEKINVATDFINNLTNTISDIPNKLRLIVSNVKDAAIAIGSAILDGIGSGIGAIAGFVGDVATMIWDAIKGFWNEKIADPIREWAIPPGVPFFSGKKPFGFFPRLHQGGIVGQGAGMAKAEGDLGNNEVMAILQKGEGVLPVSAMQKIGPKAFEVMRRGAIGDIVAMAAAGKVMAYTPRVPSSAISTRSESSGSMSGGDVYICVDTFIGEEEWFKSMADKYDMKVTAKRAKANGSQTRVISSYNNNERNTYR